MNDALPPMWRAYPQVAIAVPTPSSRSPSQTYSGVATSAHFPDGDLFATGGAPSHSRSKVDHSARQESAAHALLPHSSFFDGLPCLKGSESRIVRMRP